MSHKRASRSTAVGHTRPPSFADIQDAQRIVDRLLPRTPLVPAGRLFPSSDGARFLKLDALSAPGSFKGRGVICRLSRLTASEKRRGVITASTGNHGLAVAWAAPRFGTHTTIVLPHTVPTFKVERIRELGATVVRAGQDWNASLKAARRLAEARGLVLLEDGEDPWIMAGAGTMVLETLQERPDVDCVIVPVGGGNLIAGAAIAAKGVRRGIRVIGVQSRQAQGVYRSWRRGHIASAPCRTFAGGIATTGPAELAFRVIQRRVDDIKLVAEREMMSEIGAMLRNHSILIEGAAAAPIAALRHCRKEFAGQNVALMITGRNIGQATLARVLQSRRYRSRAE